jgi:hypothetical protein
MTRIGTVALFDRYAMKASLAGGGCLRSDRQSEVIEGDAEFVPVVLVGGYVVVAAAQVCTKA